MSRNSFIDFLKGVLITLVCVGHVIQFGMYGDVNSAYLRDPAFKSIYMFHMPLFIAISGYLALSGIRKDGGLGVYILSKFRTYAVPALVGGFAYISFFEVFFLRYGIVDYLAMTVRYLSVFLWFLMIVFVSLVITKVVRLAGRLFWPLYLVVTCCVFDFLPATSVELVMFRYLFPFFQLGYAVAYFCVPSLVARHKGLFALVCVPPVLFAWSVWNILNYAYISHVCVSRSGLQNILLMYCAGIFASLLAVLILFRVHGWVRGPAAEFVEFLGRNSICIYVLQTFLSPHILSYLTFLRVGGNWIVSAAFAMAIGVVYAAILSVSGVFISRNYWTGRLLFGRVKREFPLPEAGC